MSVDGEVPLACIVPRVFLENANADEVRHHFRQAVIVVAFHPDYFDAMLGIRQLAYMSQKLPVFLSQATEIQIRENIAQQDESAEVNALQELKGICRPAKVGTQVQVGDNHRIKILFLHAPYL